VKLTISQKAVFAAIAAMMIVLLADVLGIINIPNVALLAAVPLAIVAYFVLPSLKELERQSRR
jgi:hypothetical protein